MAVAFGTRTLSTSDPLVDEAIRLGMEFMDLTGWLLLHQSVSVCSSPAGPWTNMIDFIKPLQWLPTRARYRARKLHTDFISVYGAMINRVKARLDAGEQVSDCLVKTLLETQESEKLSWEDMCFIVIAFTTGGVHSVSEALSLNPILLTFIVRLPVSSSGS